MSSIKSTQIDGDVSVSRNAAVGGDVTVQGKTHLKGNVKIEGWLEAKNIKVNVDYEVKCETEDTLSLVLTGYEDWNASTAVTEYYNINLKDNSEITLEDLLGPDYINIANESIKAQIASDSSGLYFDEEMGGFTTITPETNFYINEAGNPIIVFQKYEIAAGAAGMPEFEITK